MTNNINDIPSYISALKGALSGQHPGLVQDAVYDAQSHLSEAMSECDDTDFGAVIRSYGTPEEVATHYVKMERDSQAFLYGHMAQEREVNGFFAPFRSLRDFKSLAYFFVALPLSLVYFAWLLLAGVPAMALSLTVAGLPLLALFLKIQGYVGLFEGQLINTLLGTRMPRRPASTVSTPSGTASLSGQLLRGLKDPHGWKISAYTALLLPLGATYFVLGCVLFFASLALIATPIIDPIIHYFHPDTTIDIQWYWLPVTSLVGIICLTLSLHVCHALTRLHSAIAQYLLISK